MENEEIKTTKTKIIQWMDSIASYTEQKKEISEQEEGTTEIRTHFC